MSSKDIVLDEGLLSACKSSLTKKASLTFVSISCLSGNLIASLVVYFLPQIIFPVTVFALCENWWVNDNSLFWQQQPFIYSFFLEEEQTF